MKHIQESRPKPDETNKKAEFKIFLIFVTAKLKNENSWNWKKIKKRSKKSTNLRSVKIWLWTDHHLHPIEDAPDPFETPSPILGPLQVWIKLRSKC